MAIAIISTLAAWFIGLVLDANLPFEPTGFLCLRVLLPVLVMGAFILAAVHNQKKDREISEKKEEKGK